MLSAASRKGWWRGRAATLGLLTTVAGSSLAYYELALESQEQRKLRVLLGSFSRALRTFSRGALTALDYKWSTFNVDEVYINIYVCV